MYNPKVDDYVIWNNKNLEGWIYFVCSSYVTIETLVRPKDEENYNHSPIHRNERLLAICYSSNWSELNYVKSREKVSSNFTQTKEE